MFRPQRPAAPVLVLLAVLLQVASTYAAAVERGVLVHDANVFLSPDNRSQRLGAALPAGTELAVMEKMSTGWIRVQPMEKSISGWILDKGLVRASTPGGDQILFGTAVGVEDQASRMRGRRGEETAKSAFDLYRLLAEYFPSSPLAPEAYYRAADVKWQVDRLDMLSRPSSKQLDPEMRLQIDEEEVRRVMKKYPHTKWADLAAYHLIDNKVCGDWQGRSKCPEKEADLYEKYVDEHPQSPVAAEALYNAATRRAALIEIYKTEEAPQKSTQSRTRATAVLQRLLSQYAQQGDWPTRARALLFLVEQGVPTYGNTPVEDVKP